MSEITEAQRLEAIRYAFWTALVDRRRVGDVKLIVRRGRLPVYDDPLPFVEVVLHPIGTLNAMLLVIDDNDRLHHRNIARRTRAALEAVDAINSDDSHLR